MGRWSTPWYMRRWPGSCTLPAGAAALDLCQVSAGRAEVFFECRLSPWDFAAGSLLVQEAGGCVTTLEGTTIDPLRPGSVFAANALCGGLTAELPRG